MKLAEMIASVGKVEYVSDWLLVDQPMIDAFADLTGDHAFIHVDPVRVAETDLGGTIAHGFLLLSLIPQLAMCAGLPANADDVRVALNYGMDKLRFISPVRSGKRVRGRFTLAACEEKKPGKFQKVTSVSLEVEGQERPALAASWLVQLIR